MKNLSVVSLLAVAVLAYSDFAMAAELKITGRKAKPIFDSLEVLGGGSQCQGRVCETRVAYSFCQGYVGEGSTGLCNLIFMPGARIVVSNSETSGTLYNAMVAAGIGPVCRAGICASIVQSMTCTKERWLIGATYVCHADTLLE